MGARVRAVGHPKVPTAPPRLRDEIDLPADTDHRIGAGGPEECPRHLDPNRAGGRAIAGPEGFVRVVVSAGSEVDPPAEHAEVRDGRRCSGRLLRGDADRHGALGGAVALPEPVVRQVERAARLDHAELVAVGGAVVRELLDDHGPLGRAVALPQGNVVARAAAATEIEGTVEVHQFAGKDVHHGHGPGGRAVAFVEDRVVSVVSAGDEVERVIHDGQVG